MPFFHGDRGRNPRYSEGGGLTGLLLEAEARGWANGAMDALTELERLFSSLSWGPRAALKSPDIAGDARRSRILSRWAQSGPGSDASAFPQAGALTRALLEWAEAEAAAAKAGGRRTRFKVRRMIFPPPHLSVGSQPPGQKVPGGAPGPEPLRDWG